MCTMSNMSSMNTYPIAQTISAETIWREIKISCCRYSYQNPAATVWLFCFASPMEGLLVNVFCKWTYVFYKKKLYTYHGQCFFIVFPGELLTIKNEMRILSAEKNYNARLRNLGEHVAEKSVCTSPKVQERKLSGKRTGF